MGSRRMLFPNCGGMPGSQEMPSSRGPPGVTDLGLGLQSLRLSGWDRPWSSQETDTHPSPSQLQSSSPSSKYQAFLFTSVYLGFTAKPTTCSPVYYYTRVWLVGTVFPPVCSCSHDPIYLKMMIDTVTSEVFFFLPFI